MFNYIKLLIVCPFVHVKHLKTENAAVENQTNSTSLLTCEVSLYFL